MKHKNWHEKSRGMRRLMVLSGWILCLTGFLAGGLIVLGISGKYNLKRQAISYAAETDSTVRTGRIAYAGGTAPGGPVQGRTITLALDSDQNSDSELKEGQIRYQGKLYDYNSDILTFLFMGIDNDRADALFLLILNSREKIMQVIPINCDTMAAVDIYDAEDIYQETVSARICTQYGFGDGGIKSCEYQAKTVSRFCYGIPIHGYFAADVDMIGEVAGVAGGIDLEAQKQFLTEFIKTIRRRTGEDATVPLKLFQRVSDRSMTDITADEVVYLTASTGGYRFDEEQVVSIPGKSISAEENDDSDYDVFYVDEEAFYKLILDIFYEAAE